MSKLMQKRLYKQSLRAQQWTSLVKGYEEFLVQRNRENDFLSGELFINEKGITNYTDYEVSNVRDLICKITGDTAPPDYY
ncbi:hypothetical protein [Acinetobacter baumannii]|uniref:hypothetical protein n=1 Tax=Acinetobacter baumannii TaxID=470 RepID=UPI0023425210|nr:hypothetical protein [Acinetobacter baumannii]MDC5678576.1 hypothetical protein [Acinetobacter baumannii]